MFDVCTTGGTVHINTIFDFLTHTHQHGCIDIPTHKTTSPQERTFFHYLHSHRLAAEMSTTMTNNFLGKQFLSCSFYLYRFRKYVSYGFPIINFCNPGVHYETPCINSGKLISDAIDEV